MNIKEIMFVIYVIGILIVLTLIMGMFMWLIVWGLCHLGLPPDLSIVFSYLLCIMLSALFLLITY